MREINQTSAWSPEGTGSDDSLTKDGARRRRGGQAGGDMVKKVIC